MLMPAEISMKFPTMLGQSLRYFCLELGNELVKSY